MALDDGASRRHSAGTTEEHEEEQEAPMQTTDSESEEANNGSEVPGNRPSRPSSLRTAGVASSHTVRPEARRQVSASSRAVSVVRIPRDKATGFLSRFSLVYEAEEPKDYPRKIKWMLTVWVALAASTAPLGSNIILPALTEITADFHTSQTEANLSIAFYILAMAIFPLWWSALSESAGRRTVYILAFSTFAVTNIASALSVNIAMFIVFRFLSGGAAASVQSVGAGTIADLFHVRERGRAMNLFEGLGWRSTQWFQVIFGAVVLLALVLLLPETHRLVPVVAEAEGQARHEVAAVQDPEKGMATGEGSAGPALSRVSSRRSVAVKTKKWAIILRRFFYDPLHIITYLRFPAVSLTVAYSSIAFGCLYFLNISVEKTFSGAPYNFSVIEVGLLYISNSFGYFVASILGGPWLDSIMAREARKAGRIDGGGKLIYLPEDRMRENAWLGAMLIPTALLCYGWTANYGVFWAAPIVANFFYGVGSMLIFSAAITMLTEFMPKKASNGVALNNFVRNIFACIGTFLANPLIDAIGNGWLFTILTVIAIAAMPIIAIMRRKGPKWRLTMDKEMD